MVHADKPVMLVQPARAADGRAWTTLAVAEAVRDTLRAHSRPWTAAYTAICAAPTTAAAWRCAEAYVALRLADADTGRAERHAGPAPGTRPR
ncbi:MAG: hypothetical protein ACTHMR_10510 [Thermomicrobiales bacterium]